MLFPSSKTTAGRRGRRTPRRGVALVFVLVFVIAMAALAMGSIFMASNSNLLAKSYDRERDLKYAAEAALQIGKSRINADPTILLLGPNSVDTTILANQRITGADGNPIPGVTVNVYVGPTGSTSGQFGRFSSIVAQAYDSAHNSGFIRRLEITQESFAKFAYWSNSEKVGSTTIYFGNKDELWGPVWSNDTISINATTAKFHDQVGTVFQVMGSQYGTFMKGKQEFQKPIPLPSTQQLNVLTTISTVSGWNFTSSDGPNNNEDAVLDRVEFIAADLAGTGDSTAINDGLFRFYTAKAGNELALRGDWPAGPPTGSFPYGPTPPSVANTKFCGDWHWIKDSNGNLSQQFYPASVHPAAWFKPQVKQGYIDKFGYSSAKADTLAKADATANLQAILTSANARCYLAGDPHLVAVDRVGQVDPVSGTTYDSTTYQRGGLDTTFTPNGVYGSWKLNTTSPNATVAAVRPWDARYVYPVDRMFNANGKGVITATGNLGVSGTVNGRMTVYAKGTLVLLDDIRYANDPVKGVCRDILGLISDKDIVIADNAINTPQLVATPNTWFSLDDTKDFYIHAVLMALGTGFRVERYNLGPTNVNDCDVTTDARGCIYLSGGIIQNVRGAVGLAGGRGYAKRYTYDHCAVINPPPYFPTTGRFLDNRYLELDPAGFDHVAYFKSLTPLP